MRWAGALAVQFTSRCAGKVNKRGRSGTTQQSCLRKRQTALKIRSCRHRQKPKERCAAHQEVLLQYEVMWTLEVRLFRRPAIDDSAGHRDQAVADLAVWALSELEAFVRG